MSFNKFPSVSINFRAFCFIFFSVLIGILSSFGLAAETEIRLSVAPEMFEWQVERGQQFSDKIKIYNTSSIPVPIEVSVTNFGAQEESGTMTFYDEPISGNVPEARPLQVADDISYNPRKWIKIENPNFILESKETEEVRLEVSIPENAEPGGHYAVALFEPKLPSYYFEKETLKAISKIGVLFLFSVEVEGTERSEEPLVIVEFDIPEQFHLRRLENFVASFAGLFSEVKAEEKKVFSVVETSHLPFALRIKNHDIYHIRPKGKLSILAMNGKVVGETEVKETTILPGRIRKIPVEFQPTLSEQFKKYLPATVSSFISKNLLFGKYQASLYLSVGSSTIEKDFEFWVFPWKVWLSTILVLATFLFFVIKYKSRIRLAIKALIRKSD